MKKLLLSFVTLLLTITLAVAQDTPADALKKAVKALSSYNLDQTKNADKLDEAKKLIDAAVQWASAEDAGKAWNTRGQIYSDLINRVALKQTLDKTYKDPYEKEDIAFIAYESFKKGYEVGTKKWDKKDAAKGINAVMGHLQNLGATRYSEKNFASAYNAFNAIPDANALVLKEGEKSTKTAEELGQFKFYAAVCADGGGLKAEALKAYNELKAANYPDAGIFDGIYRLTVDTDEATALAALEEGRKRFPDETSLLFSEINYYLKKNQLNILIDKLKLAISKEPNNPSLYTTLGSVYDNLSQKASEDATKKEDSKMYFDEAMSYFKKAVDLDPTNADAIYSLGALWYNKAAKATQELQKLSDDYSKEGIKKYDAKKLEIDDLFKQALPYFQKAEGVDPNDKNVLIALKEIMARQGKFDASNEFKKRIENVDAGQKNQPYKW